MKPDQGAPILDRSVEAEGPAPDLCSGRAPDDLARERILVWLGEGVREVTWALCSMPRERWTQSPPSRPAGWPVLRHIRHLALRETHQVLPMLRQALGESSAEAPALSTLELEQLDAAWDATSAGKSADSLVRSLGETRFDLLQRLEAAPDDGWRQADLDVKRMLLSARQHELEHLAAIWKVALNWERSSLDTAPVPSVPLHPADRLEESH